MGSQNRKIRRNKLKKVRKKAKKGLKDAVRSIAGLPTKCTQCSKEFDLQKDADNWYVDMTGGVTQLLCPACLRTFLTP